MTGRRSVKLDWYGDQISGAIKQHGDRALAAAGSVVLRAAKARAPSRSGTLRASGYVQTARSNNHKPGRADRRPLPKPPGPGVVLVAFAAFYAHIIEGTGAPGHRIPKKRRRILRIDGIGYKTAVLHPGIKRRAFLGPALTATRAQMTQALAAELRAGLERGAK